MTGIELIGLARISDREHQNTQAIHKDEKGFYIALDEVSYDEEYFNYEDNYIHYLPVEYIFSLDNQCSNGIVSASIKQIIVRPDREGYLFTQQKPLTELKYN